MPKIFEGLRILDCSQFISGPWTSIFFADQGAEVIDYKLNIINRTKILNKSINLQAVIV